MGSEFIRAAAKSFKKSWDKRRIELATADLFTQQPTCAARVAQADIVGDAHLHRGEAVVVQTIGSELIAMRELSIVARFTNPTNDLVEAVHSSCGIAKGTIEQVHPISGVVEISVC